MAAELAPLGSRVDFQGRCLQENEGFGKPYYWVTQKRLFRLCFKFPREISTQGHETKITGTKGEGETLCFCSDFPQTASPVTGSPWFELVAVKKIRHSGTLTTDFTANLQLPTLWDLNSLHSFADIYQEATMNERKSV